MNSQSWTVALAVAVAAGMIVIGLTAGITQIVREGGTPTTTAIGNADNPTATRDDPRPTPTSAVTVVTTDSQPLASYPTFNEEYFGLNVYNGEQIPIPPPPGENQVIVANGDVQGNNTCHIRVFRTGETVGGLGRATFELRRITGSPDQIQRRIDEIQAGSAGAPNAHGSCDFG